MIYRLTRVSDEKFCRGAARSSAILKGLQGGSGGHLLSTVFAVDQCPLLWPMKNSGERQLAVDAL